MKPIWRTITRVAYWSRRALPMPVGDASKTLSLYAFCLIERVSAPSKDVTPEKRLRFLELYASRFVEDISVDRLVQAFIERDTVKDAVLDFEKMADHAVKSRPSISLILRVNRAIYNELMERPELEAASRHLTMVSRFLRRGLQPGMAGTIQALYGASIDRSRNELLHGKPEEVTGRNRQSARGQRPKRTAQVVDAVLSRNEADAARILDEPDNSPVVEPRSRRSRRDAMRVDESLFHAEDIFEQDEARIRKRRESSYFLGIDLEQFNFSDPEISARKPRPAPVVIDTSDEELSARDIAFRHVRVARRNETGNLGIRLQMGRYRGTNCLIYWGSRSADAVDARLFFGQTSIHVVVDRSDQIEGIFATLEKALGPQVELSASVLISDGAPHYSVHESRVTRVSDDIGRNVVRRLSQHRVIERHLGRGLRDCLALAVSDAIFRTVQRHYSLLNIVRQQNPEALFVIDALSSAVVDASQFIDTFIYDDPAVLTRTKREFEHVLAPDFGFVDPQLLRRTIRKKWQQIREILPQPQSDATKARLFVLGNSRARPYATALSQIDKQLSDTFELHMLDFAATTQMQKPKEASSYQLAGKVFSEPGDRYWRDFEELAAALVDASVTMRASPDIGFDGIAATVTPVLSRLLASTIPSMILAHAAIRYHFSAPGSIAAALCVPGRQAEIRCLIDAFRDAGHATHDMQVLFISESERYCAPIAWRSAVIDTNARDVYRHLFNVPEANIDVIGSITLDVDMAECDSADRKQALSQLFPDGVGDRRVITFASQPVSDDDLRATLEAICETVIARPELALQVKLHPGQGEDKLRLHKDIVAKYFRGPDSARATVLRDFPFFKSLVASDLLITYFSNAALLAAVRGVPVVTLPIRGFKAPIELDKLGVSLGVRDLSDLSEAVQRLLNHAPGENPDLPPAPYLRANPQMADRGTLKRLAETILADIGRREAMQRDKVSA